MLLGGDLGFLARVVAVALVVVFAPVVGFLVRRKWLRSLARKEEIKRLLVLASEEIERAELDAEFGYGYDAYSYGLGGSSVVEVEGAGGVAEVKEEEKVAEVVAPAVEVPVPALATVQEARRLQYECEVCRSPTTTRCARCKAVRYCSGKCQIIHWRQGHKDECHPVAVGEQSHEMGDNSPLKPPKGKESEIHSSRVEVGGRHSFKSVEEYSDSSVLKLSDGDDATKVKSCSEEKVSQTNSIAPMSLNELPRASSNGSSLNASTKGKRNDASPRHQLSPSSNVTEGADMGNCIAVAPKMVNSEANFAASLEDNLMEPNPVEGDSPSGSSISSLLSVGGCNESSYEPSTTSSGFWDGTIDLLRSRVDILDDNTDSCSDEVVDVGDLSSQLPTRSTVDLAGASLPQRDVFGTCEEKVSSEGPHLPISKIKKPAIEPSPQMKANKGSEETSLVNASDFSSEKVSKSGEFREFAASSEAKATNLHSSIPEKSSKVAGHRSISQDSKDFDKILSSKPARYLGQNAKSFKDDSAHRLSPYSTDFNGYSKNGQSYSKPSVWKVVDQLRTSKLVRLSSSGAATENVARYNSKGLFPYDIFVNLYYWNKVELLPCGLMNCGNSCYANAILQCLSFTPPLTAYFLQGLHSKACKKNDWCFTCELESLVLKAKEGNSPISPSRIISRLQKIGSHLGNGTEEDAHEFLRYAIDTMQACCLKESGASASGSLEETTLLGLTFGGYLRSKIECMRCEGKSEQHERMMDVTVGIEGNIGTLEEALRQFTHTETLDGENKYQCSRCKSYEKAKKKLRVLEAPNVLTIVLKRFQSGKFGKLNKMIKFPDILDLAPYMAGTSDKSPIYRLYGVVVHLDIMNSSFSGHYVCYIKNTRNKWFKIDDSMVKAVERENVLTEGAYMLFYARCSPRAPRVIRSSLVTRDPRKAKNRYSKQRHHSRGPWDASVDESHHYHASDESLGPNYSSFSPFHTIWEEDSSSDKSSSLFSEANSCSTDSSNRDSMCTDDFFDQILCSSPWRSWSDSETSSSSSSPSPLYSRHYSPIDMEAYASRRPETSDRGYGSAASAASSDSSRLPNRREAEVTESKGSTRTPFLCPDSSKRSSKLGGSSSSCRENSSSKLGWVNPFENLKSSITFRRSMMRGRSSD